MMGLWTLENEIYAEGYKLICGVDEAGRGPLAGPVCAAAVILPQGLELDGLNDSKKLSEAKRERLFDEICEKSVSYAIAMATVEEIEELNILKASLAAMSRAIEKLPVKPELALIDGDKLPESGLECRSIIKGDSKCADIAAASILAKVTRDRYMKELAREYPQYAFEKHKGYGTALHYERLREFGPSPVHRAKFLRKMH